MKKLLVLAIPPVLVAGEKSGNTGNTDTHLRGSPPSIAVEPGLPTPAMARTNGPGRTRRRFCLRQSLRQWKHLNTLPSPVGNPAATKRAPCHIHPSHWPKKHRLTLKRRSLGQETADYTHPTSPVAFGLWRQALLSQSTGLTIGLVGQINGSLSKGILLTDAHSTRDLLRRDSAVCRPLATQKPCQQFDFGRTGRIEQRSDLP